MTDDLQAAIERVREDLSGSRLDGNDFVYLVEVGENDVRIICDALDSIPVYRITEGHGTTPEEGRMDELAELLITQCNASLYELVAIAKLAAGESTDIRGTDDGVAFKVERIR